MAEVLCYQQLLETNKTYVMSLQRLPALATFLLFARKSMPPPFSFFVNFRLHSRNRRLGHETDNRRLDRG